jgi:hypothetical protein
MIVTRPPAGNVRKTLTAHNAVVPGAPWMVLIGPAGAGKSTLGELAAAATGRPFTDIDEVAGVYYAQAGWTLARLAERAEAAGRHAAEREWEPARVHAAEQVIAAHPGGIVAFGAGHTFYEQPGLAERIRAALRPVRHVVLVLPSPDPVRSVEVLRKRSLAEKGTDWTDGEHDLLRQWVTDPGNLALATVTLYTEGEPPDASAARLLRLCGEFPGPAPSARS